MDVKQHQSAGGIVINKKGQIAVVQNKEGSWTFPKGTIKEGEEPLQTAHREVYEEAGLSKLTYVRSYEPYQRYQMKTRAGIEDKNILKTIHMFLFTTGSKQQKLTPLDPENPEAKWVEKDEVVKILTHCKDKEFFQNILNQLP